MKKIGINDIASELGISRNTVSKVMNGRGTVSDKIKNKVIDTAVRMGYEKLPPELLEQYQVLQNSLEEVKNKSKNILVIATSPDFSSFWVKMIRGITQQLVKYNYKCLYNFITFDDVNHFELPDIMSKGDIAGIIVINVYNKDTVRKIASTGLPAVYFDIPLDVEVSDIKADVVVVEGRRSIFQITKSLMAQKDKKIGFIGDINYCKSIEERWRGFVRAHNDAGIKISNEYCFIRGKKGHFYFEKEIEGVVENMIQEFGKPPNAFVCANDDIAYRLIKELKKYGYSVPKDVRVSGFDDIENVDDEEKMLTTISINIQEVGERLAEQILWRVNNPIKNFEEIKIFGTVKFRKSTEKIKNEH